MPTNDRTLGDALDDLVDRVGLGTPLSRRPTIYLGAFNFMEGDKDKHGKVPVRMRYARERITKFQGRR